MNFLERLDTFISFVIKRLNYPLRINIGETLLLMGPGLLSGTPCDVLIVTLLQFVHVHINVPIEPDIFVGISSVYRILQFPNRISQSYFYQCVSVCNFKCIHDAFHDVVIPYSSEI